MASSDQHDTVFGDEDIDDDEEEEELDDDVLPDDDENDPFPSTSSVLAVTIAVAPPISPATTASDSKRNQIEEKKPIDDSRKLFQRLWTDEDEIELLQGFLDYTSHRGSSHHNDTALFYDQIKSKFQIDFNKNQLVEKIRRLKKKYRNVLNKINSGKEFSFKSPHDQATFEISRKIWSNIGQISGGFVVDDNVLDEDEINLNSNQNPNNHYPNHNPNINLNLVQSMPKYEAVMLGNSGEKKFTPSRKRSRPRSTMLRIDEKPQVLFNDGSGSGLGLNLNLNKDHNCIINSNTAAANVNNDKNYENNCNSEQQHINSIPGLVEETVRSCLTPVLKELMGGGVMGGGSFGARGFGIAGFGSLNSMQMPMVMPLSYLGLGSGGHVVDEKWRKQQILELEVYAKRLELVQDQIKAALGELRSAGG
ncbi:PREDICTED: probable transcription factor At3g04930 isoform X2 [Lupinus angustifolius]|uniref:probable transcription factor At3g04930 isoform X2 n=1 Tax=Lupinus angustifolius TaxID=3871 RepID=UPI00092FCAE7|nr:PREDICTED: probable transcription factor At3g04930 isoform X2 [Lupinus angustifolius]